MPVNVCFFVNNQAHDVVVGETDMLVGVLRDQLGYVGTNRDCGQGICGCCTVLIDGKAATSCLTIAAQMDGAKITTVEGLETDGRLSVLQRAFVEHGAAQCGFCTPGFLMSATGLLSENPHPTREEIVDALRGNLCRCTGYVKIIDAVAAAAAAAGDMQSG
jgi:aerobic-type carbon monoxide dehydrogenase small subunit (CoxS/CutS family)